jgi:predicted acylesterase/phospholipase RssA
MGGVNPNGQDTLVDLEVVKAAEIDHLRQRRGGLGEWSELRDPLNGIAGDDNPLAELFSDTADKAWADHPSLFGIALSGGGIRSATFSLGVLQALAARGLFRQAHYLSTVSGGGYMGGCFNAMNATPPEGEQKGMEAVFAHKAYQQESAAFRHLRAYSRFLAPSGAADTLRMVAQPLMGTLTNLAVLLSLMLFVAAVGGMLSFIRPVAWP